MWQKLSLAGGCVGVAVMVLVLTVAPVRAWAESLLAIFRVERFTVLEINPAALKNNGLQNNQLLNQAIGRVLSDEVTVTQKPQQPQLIADAATASKVAGFPVQLLPGKTPSSLLLESGAGMNMKLDRDRIQSILDEAGRSDLRIPESVDGAIVGVRVPAGVMAFYGNCGDVASRVMGQAVASPGRRIHPRLRSILSSMLAVRISLSQRPAGIKPAAGTQSTRVMPRAFPCSSFPARSYPLLKRSTPPRLRRSHYSFLA